MQLNFKQFKEQMPQNGQEIIVNNGAKKLSIVTFKNDLSKLRQEAVDRLNSRKMSETQYSWFWMDYQEFEQQLKS